MAEPAPGARLLHVPAVKDLDRLTDLVARAAFHFHFVEPHALRFLVASEMIDAARDSLDRLAVPPQFDPAIASHLALVRDRIELIPADRADPASEVVAADRVLLWDRATADDPEWRGALEGLATVAADRDRDRLEGSAYVDLGAALFPGMRRLLNASRMRFNRWAAELGRAERAYLLGTGPSIERHGEFDFDGLVIACNTTILDEALMRHARPRFLAFADPIFHFGVSAYAAAFRAELSAAAEAHDLWLVIPAKYGPLFASLLPDLAERTVSVPMLSRSVPNLDLTTRFEVRRTQNVLTLLQLPLATTLAREVRMIGYDGRDRADDYFWRHSARTQDHERLAGVRQVHPGFFDVDYAEYYDHHVADLEMHVLTAEAAGHPVLSLTDSHVPALRRRLATPRTAPLDQPTEAAFLVASVNPDLVDDFGHYAQFDAVLGRAAEAAGGALVSLASRARPAAPAEAPVFTHPTWAGAHGPPAAFAASFHRELVEAVGGLVNAAQGTPLHVVMYSAALWHLPAMLAVAHDLRDAPVTFDVNLLRSHDEILRAAEDPGAGRRAATILREAQRLGASLRVRLHADSAELADAWAELTGSPPAVWPIFSVSELPRPGGAPSRAPANRPLRAYCPATMQAAKGYDVLAAAAELLASDPAARDIQLVARAVPMPTGTPPAMVAAADRLRAAGAELVSGVLSPDVYAAELCKADIVVIPYRVDPFRTRTSAVFADAVQLGRPVVATAGTWAGRLTSEHGIGETFRDGDPEDLSRAVRAVAADYDRYLARAGDVAPVWAGAHQPGALLEAIRQSPEPAPDPGGVEHRIELLSRILDLAGGDDGLAPLLAALDARVFELEAALEASGIDVPTLELAAVQERDRRIAELEHENAQLRLAFRNRAWNALKRAAGAGAARLRPFRRRRAGSRRRGR